MIELSIIIAAIGFLSLVFVSVMCNQSSRIRNLERDLFELKSEVSALKWSRNGPRSDKHDEGE